MNDSASSRASMFFARTGIEQDQSRLKDIRGFESPGVSDPADNLHDVNLNSSFRMSFVPRRKQNAEYSPVGACFSGCFDCSRKQKLIFVATFVFLACAAAGAVVMVTVGFGSWSEEGSSGGGFQDGPEKEEFPLGDEHDRFDDIRNYILSAGITQQDDLDDEGSAQNKALWWIANDDNAQVKLGSCELIQRYALATFFFSTFAADDHPNWDTSTNWMTENSVCEWYGIKCVSSAESENPVEASDHMHVFHLDLADNNVKGTIPSELAALEELRMINLSENGLFGSIPESLGNIRHLSEFKCFFYNQIVLHRTFSKRFVHMLNTHYIFHRPSGGTRQ